MDRNDAIPFEKDEVTLKESIIIVQNTNKQRNISFPTSPLNT